jgi:hypothetical protein
VVAGETDPLPPPAPATRICRREIIVVKNIIWSTVIVTVAVNLNPQTLIKQLKIIEIHSGVCL